ncbi:MAG: histidine--tRNA ligase [Oligoflexia bacterium]|nr:histidine--tRNA ligase [Oligoflexia bacterium]
MLLKKVRGFPDHLEEDCLKYDSLLSVSAELLKKFNFSRINPPVLEYSELFSRTLGEESDIVNKEMYSFQKGEDSFTLRPEGTAGVARMFITQKLDQQLPLRWFYYGPMFRHERPQKGRFRQFHQLGVELLGDKGELADIEILSLAWLLIKQLQLESKVCLEINSLGAVEERAHYKQKLKKFLLDFKNKLSVDSQIRLDKNPLRIWDSKEEPDQEILKKAPLLKECLKSSSLNKYEKIKQLLTQFKIPFKENHRLVRGLDYYNDLVFEWTSQDLGAQSAFLAGGRYDGLISQLGGKETSAIGWALGLERLSLLCQTFKPKPLQLAFISSGQSAQEKAFQLAYELRAEGFSVYHHFSGNFSKQMKRAGQKCLFALIYGEKEHNKQEIILKNLTQGDQTCLPLSSLQSELKKKFKV